MEKVDPFERHLARPQADRYQVQPSARDPRTAATRNLDSGVDAGQRYPQPTNGPDYEYFADRARPRGPTDDRAQGQKPFDPYSNDSNFVLQKSAKSPNPSELTPKDPTESGLGRKNGSGPPISSPKIQSGPK